MLSTLTGHFASDRNRDLCRLASGKSLTLGAHGIRGSYRPTCGHSKIRKRPSEEYCSQAAQKLWLGTSRCFELWN